MLLQVAAIIVGAVVALVFVAALFCGCAMVGYLALAIDDEDDSDGR